TLPLIVARKNATSASDRLMPSCRPTALSSSGVGSFALATDSSFFSGATLLADRSSLHVDDVLLVVIRVLLEIADGGSVRRRLLQVALQHLERPVLCLSDVAFAAALLHLRLGRGPAGG